MLVASFSASIVGTVYASSGAVKMISICAVASSQECSISVQAVRTLKSSSWTHNDFDEGNLLRSICRGKLSYVIRLRIDLREPSRGSVSAQREYWLDSQFCSSHQSQHRLATPLIDHPSEVQSQRLDGLPST